ncbi:MAG TPA: conjugal transfer protein TrbC [Halothiobacillus sp.]|nr:conjugal transfer protein TrbC [Halothiobacillus sp.]
MTAIASVSLFRLNLRKVFASPAFWLVLCATLLFFGAIEPVHAADAVGAKGEGLPWEGPLEKLQKSISGPVAFIIALLGILATGATLIWGGEISEFTRRIIYVVLAVSIIVFANSLLSGVMFSGATVPEGITITLADMALPELPAFSAHNGMGGL